MGFYDVLHIPQPCLVDKTVAKKLFAEAGDLSKPDKALLSEAVEKITWKYCLKNEFIPIQPYADKVRDYPEAEVLEVSLATEKGLRRLAEIIMRAIPYPMLLVFRLGEQVQVWMAHQRISLADRDKVTLEEFVSTPWYPEDSLFWTALDIRELRFTNFFDFYTDWVDRLSVQNAQEKMQMSKDLTGEEARQLLAQQEQVEKEIAALRAELKKETQFSRKVELNMRIKHLKQKC
ncbi:MAG: DUF4391 domain-containing protein [Oscillospiraceae bacterium]|nr:DUF4391 domain-containing protein [Oscillospiraceae bacterium]